MLLDRLLFGSSSDSWLAQYGTALNNVIASDMAIDTGGNIYVCGEEGGLPVLLKLDRFSNVLWARRMWGLSGRFAKVAIDSSGNAYVGGTASSSQRLLMASYDAAGTLLWAKLDGPTATGSTSGVNSIHVASTGTIYFGCGARPSTGANQIGLVLGVNSSGTVTFRRQLAVAGSDALGIRLLFDGTNVVSLSTLITGSPIRNVGLLTIINTSGTILTNLDDDDGANSVSAWDLARGSSGNLYLAQSNLVTKTDAAGSVLWQRQYKISGDRGADLVIVDGDTPWFANSNEIFSITPAGVLAAQIRITHATARIVAMALDPTFLYVCFADAEIGGREVTSVMKLRRAILPVGGFAGFTLSTPAESLFTTSRAFGAGSVTSAVNANSSANAGGADVAAVASLSYILGL